MPTEEALKPEWIKTSNSAKMIALANLMSNVRSSLDPNNLDDGISTELTGQNYYTFKENIEAFLMGTGEQGSGFIGRFLSTDPREIQQLTRDTRDQIGIPRRNGGPIEEDVKYATQVTLNWLVESAYQNFTPRTVSVGIQQLPRQPNSETALG